MKKVLRYLFVILSLITLIATGCGNSENSADNIAANIIEKVVPVNSDGSLNIITPTGVTAKAEANTFSENVNVKILEDTPPTGLSNYFSNASPLFTISAEKTVTTSFGDVKSKVTNVEKPVIITVPNNIRQKGIYYLGSRANSSKDWKYTIINDNNSERNPIVVSSRYSLNNNASEFYISTFNVDFQFSVFVETEEHFQNTPKSVITDLIPQTSYSEYQLENNCYTENLAIKVQISGDSIENIKPSDYMVEIGFLNNDWSSYDTNSLPIYGAVPTYSVSKAYAGAGSKYKHTITLKNISDFNNNTFAFDIGLNKISPKVFPATFTITVKVEGTPYVLAYEGTKSITLTEKVKEPEKPEKPKEPEEPEEPKEPEHKTSYIKVVETMPANSDMKIATDSASIITIKFADELDPGTDWDSYVTMEDSSSNVPLQYEYNNRTLILKHNGLQENTLYAVRIKNGIKGAEPYSKTVPYSFVFSTAKYEEPYIPEISYITITETSPANGSVDVATDSSSIIRLNIGQELSPENDLTSFVTMTGSNGNSMYTVEYEDKAIIIKHNGLIENNNYTVIVKAGLKGLEPYTEFTATALSFTTVKPETSYITAEMTCPASNNNVATATSVVIAFSNDLVWENNSERLVKLSDGMNIITCDYLYSNRILTLTPRSKLQFNKLYTVTVSQYLKPANEYTDISEEQQFTFTTENFEITPHITGDSSKMVNGKYYLTANHKFTVDFQRPLIEPEKAGDSIVMLKNNVPFSKYTVSFDSENRIATVNVDVAFESDANYTIMVNEFQDGDNATIKTASENYTAMTGITVTSVELASGTEWLIASGSSDVSTSGSVRVSLSQPVEPTAVKIINAQGIEKTTGITYNTLTKSTNIELSFSGLSYMATYGIEVICKDETTGQEFVSDQYTFSTGLPCELELQNPEEPNSESNPYLVCSAKALDSIRKPEFRDKGFYYKQMNDIDLATSTYVSETNTETEGWDIMSTSMYDDPILIFYDGNNKTINNLSIYRPEAEFASLFGALGGGLIKNLYLENVNITAGYFSAPLAACAVYGTVANCHCSGTITGYSTISGLIAYQEGSTISDCSSEVTIFAYSDYSGGLVGNNMSGVISNSYYRGNLTGYSNVGGLIGRMLYGTIRDSHVTGTVSGYYYVGGLTGYSDSGIIINSYTDNITVTGEGSEAGGLVGYNTDGTISQSHATGKVNGNSMVGGLIGNNNSAVTNSYSDCEVTGISDVGGFIGSNDGTVANDCYAEGTVNGVAVSAENIIGIGNPIGEGL